MVQSDDMKTNEFGCGLNDEKLPTIEELLANPCTSFAVKDAIKAACRRDPVQVANEFDLLAKVFDKRAKYAVYG